MLSVAGPNPKAGGFFIMAKDKKSVLLYCDILFTVEELSNEEAGKLFKHYLRYINDLDPVAPDKLTQIVFEPIKQNLKRDLKTWRLRIKKRSDAGKKGMASRWSSDNKVITNDNNVIKPITNITDTVIVTVKDTVTVKDIKESNTPDLSKSNLFRKPNIPTLEDVHRLFLQNGGSEEMATAFFEKNNSVGWFLKGSPITNFVNLIPSFIKNWNEIKNKNGKQFTKNKLGNKSGGFGILNDALREAGLG